MGIPKVSPFHTPRGLFISCTLDYLQEMKTSLHLPTYGAHWLTLSKFGPLLLIETAGKETERIQELITQWVLRGSFHLIAGSNCIPDYDDLQYSVSQFTNAFNETLDNMTIGRARTCFQLLDLLREADNQNKPVLILDFLHHFYNQDLKISLRDHILEQCCQYTKRLSFCNPVVVLVPKLKTEDYNRFYPLLAGIADEILSKEEGSFAKASQGSLF